MLYKNFWVGTILILFSSFVLAQTTTVTIGSPYVQQSNINTLNPNHDLPKSQAQHVFERASGNKNYDGTPENRNSYHNDSNHRPLYNNNAVVYNNMYLFDNDSGYFSATESGTPIQPITQSPSYSNNTSNNYNNDGQNENQDNINNLINMYNSYQEQVAQDVQLYNFYKTNHKDDMANGYLNDYHYKIGIMNDLYSEIQGLQNSVN
jgi:hypothetical protein